MFETKFHFYGPNSYILHWKWSNSLPCLFTRGFAFSYNVWITLNTAPIPINDFRLLTASRIIILGSNAFVSLYCNQLMRSNALFLTVQVEIKNGKSLKYSGYFWNQTVEKNHQQAQYKLKMYETIFLVIDLLVYVRPWAVVGKVI